jgi:hypothetical protein
MTNPFTNAIWTDANHSHLRYIPRNIVGVRWWIGLVLFFGSVVLLSFLLGTIAEPGSYNDDCSKLHSDRAVLAGDTAQGPTLASGQTSVLKFGIRGGSTSRSLSFDNPAKVVPTAKPLDDFNRGDGNGRFPITALKVAVEGVDSSTAPSSLQVTVCANRDSAHVQPGSYTGTIVLNNGPGTARVPFTITLSTTQVRSLVTTYFSLVVIFGSFYSWALQKSITADQNVLGLSAVQRYLMWLPTLAGVIGLVAGTAAALAIFNAQYLASDVWGSDLKDYWGLLGAMFLAFIGAATVARVPGMRTVAAPTVTAVAPNMGPVAGRNGVKITGSNFAGAVAVAFDDTLAENVRVESDNTITVDAPAHAAGTVHVAVTTPAGTSATSDADQFTYQ